MRVSGCVLFAIALAVAAPASAAGLFAYATHYPVAELKNGEGHKFKVYLHPHESSIMLAAPASMSVVGKNPAKWPEAEWRAAAEQFLGTSGCAVADLHPLLRVGADWEAVVACPDGVDIHALAKAQKAALKQGDALQAAVATAPAS
jgi:hypothetical protein